MYVEIEVFSVEFRVSCIVITILILTAHASCISIQFKTKNNIYESLVCIYFIHES